MFLLITYYTIARRKKKRKNMPTGLYDYTNSSRRNRPQLPTSYLNANSSHSSSSSEDLPNDFDSTCEAESTCEGKFTALAEDKYIIIWKVDISDFIIGQLCTQAQDSEGMRQLLAYFSSQMQLKINIMLATIKSVGEEEKRPKKRWNIKKNIYKRELMWIVKGWSLLGKNTSKQIYIQETRAWIYWYAGHTLWAIWNRDRYTCQCNIQQFKKKRKA